MLRKMYPEGDVERPEAEFLDVIGTKALRNNI
jgi:hypothetical protein